MSVDLELLASIASGGLGQWVEGTDGQPAYSKSDDCVGCLKDLQRFFRDDDPEMRPAFFAVHKYNFARSDLVPLIVTHPDEYEVVYNALKVATFLTMPSQLETSANLAQQAEHIQRVREAFLAQDALAVVVGLLAEPLSRHPRMRPEDAVMVQLVITFLRNLVALPTAPPAAAGGGSSAAQDTNRRIRRGLLERLFADNVMDLLLLLAQHARDQPFRSETAVLVETFLHLLRDLQPEQLLDAEATLRAEQEQQAAQQAQRERSQQAQRSRQAAQHGRSQGGALPTLGSAPRLPPRPQQGALVHLPKLMAVGNRAVTQNAPSRHSRSDAVYVRRHVDHNRAVVLRNHPAKTELPQLPSVVNPKLAQAERREGAGASRSARLGGELLLKMRGFLEQFLQEGAYNILMGQMFKQVQPGLGLSRYEAPEFVNFVELATLATKYVRVKEERKLRDKGHEVTGGQAGSLPAEGSAVGKGAEGDEEAPSPFNPISSTMGWDTFYWCLKLWLEMLGGMQGRKKNVLRKGELPQAVDSDRRGLIERAAVEWRLQHASVPLLKEMLLTLDLARLVGTEADQRAADRLQRRLMHDDLKESGLLPVLSRLIRDYNFRFQPRSHAVDLVETLHIVLGILDRLNSAEGGGFRVRQKAHTAPKRKPRAPAGAAPNVSDGEEGREGATGQQQQQQEAGEVGKARSRGELEQQRGSGRPPEGQAGPDGPASPQAVREAGSLEAAAVGTPQSRQGAGAAAEHAAPAAEPAGTPAGDGPGGAAFTSAAGEDGTAEAGETGSPADAQRSGEGGSSGPAPTPRPATASRQAAAAAGVEVGEGTGAAVDADCVSAVGTPGGIAAGGSKGGGAATPTRLAPRSAGGDRAGEARGQEEGEGEEGEEEERRPVYKEVALDVIKRVKQECAFPVMVHFYSWLLQGYASNGPFTNHALLSFLSRIADPHGLNLEPMLYQLSVLRVFHAILADSSLRKKPEFEPLLRFATRVVRNMFERLVPDLFKLQAAVAEAEAVLAGEEGAEACTAGEAREGHSSGPTTPGEAEDARKKVELELKLREECAAMAFVELMFWKGAGAAEDMRDQYNWQKLLDPPPSPRARRGRRRSNRGDDDSDDGKEEGPDLFATARHSRRPTFDADKEQQLREAFEQCNGHKDCLDRLVHEFGGMFKRGQISRQLKQMGLARGKLTPLQVERLRELYQQHCSSKVWPELLEADLDAGFTAGQIKRQLKALGVITGKAKGKKAKRSREGIASSSDDDHQAGGLADSEAVDSDSGSDDEGDGVEYPKPDMANSDLEGKQRSTDGSTDEKEAGAGKAGKATALQRLSSALGTKRKKGVKVAKRAAPHIGSIEFGAFIEGEGDCDIEAPRQQPQQAVRNRLRKAGAGSKPAAAAAAFAAAVPAVTSSDGDGSSDSDGGGASFVSMDQDDSDAAGHAGAPVPAKRRKQQAAQGVGADAGATQELVSPLAPWPVGGADGKAAAKAADKATRAAGAGQKIVRRLGRRSMAEPATKERMPTDLEDLEDDSPMRHQPQQQQQQERPSPSAGSPAEAALVAGDGKQGKGKRPAAGAAGSDSSSDSEGGDSFVTLQDSGEEEPDTQQAQQDTAATEQRQKAAVPAQQPSGKPAKKARTTTAAAPTAAAEAAAVTKAGAARGQVASGKEPAMGEAKPKRPPPSPAASSGDGSGSDSDAASDGFVSAEEGGKEDGLFAAKQQPGKERQPKRQKAGGTAAAAAVKRRHGGQAAVGDEQGSSSDDDEAPLWASAAAHRSQRSLPAAAAVRLVALEVLRRKRLGLTDGVAAESAPAPVLPPATEPFGAWPDTERPPLGALGSEDMGSRAPPAKHAKQGQQGGPPQGRRLLKRQGATAAAPAQALDLEDSD
ncbi:hypothetical protein N2152v2_008420 [Parachlorella kessleri]